MGFMFFVILACDPLEKGYKKNPAYVLDQAFRAINNLDRLSFREVTSKEALCLYGNDQGLDYLKLNLDFNVKEINVIPKLLESRHYSSPLYVGYWSYYKERYSVEIYHKVRSDLIITSIVECDYGTEDQKNDRLINQKPGTYQKKECKIVKIIPESFPGLADQKKCNFLKVTQSH
jgi:hypothetical protein